MLDVVKTVRPVVENLGDDEGAFPSRSKFVWFVLIHSEDQISFLEGSALHISGLESTQVLLIDGRSDHTSPPLGGRLRLAGLALLRLRYKARLWGRCEVDHSAGRLRLRRRGRTG